MTAVPGDQTAAGTAAHGRLRASHADREHVIDTLKAAFVQGRLTKDEFDARVGQTLASRTYADLAALTADIPTGLARAQPPRKPAPAQTRRPVNTPVKAGVRAIIAAIMMLAAPFAADGAHHPLAAVALVVGAIIIFVAAFIAWAWVLSSQPEKAPAGSYQGRQHLGRPVKDPSAQHLPPRLNSSRRSTTLHDAYPKLREAIFLARNFPARGHRINGALSGVAARSATPTIDPVPAPRDSAPMRKMEGTRTRLKVAISVPVACPVRRSYRASHNHWRTVRQTPWPAAGQVTTLTPTTS